ncbi:50S ribosomal protein L25 [Dissulfurirhabdus thermomarina]|uniref:Large ribosomal subunit protein bL25 n=1 Tax=Dissulfurirhabdus thermomarina TaxID=1765737 RepID=A0A6N9TLG2_DISTH|nr:50S ribosomal protein L25 [Dissulfurirhabdus thermomarina]NDY42065.1 50S ribosomal protein L25 [Dissulfurirhabdus thermomarina]NMX24539.1 50S ribosomal protein L25 [Dissulfurirhabdus thermomarina]
MEQVSIAATVRTETGKGAARKLRRQGMLPGILYGRKTEPVPLAVDFHGFWKVLNRIPRSRLLCNLELGDQGPRLALVKDLQLHPVSDQIRHVDFYEVYMDEPVETEVPVRTVGKARGVEIGKGVLQVIRRTLRISCLPTDIPDALEVEVSALDVGDALHVSDIEPPAGIRLLDAPHLAVVTVSGAGGGMEEPAEEGEEAEEILEEAPAEAPEAEEE